VAPSRQRAIETMPAPQPTSKIRFPLSGLSTWVAVRF
jgi:hypothetical protein